MAMATMLHAQEGSLKKMFSYKAMRMVMGYLSTYNMEDQALVIGDSDAGNIEATGGGSLVINGIPYTAGDASTEIDLSADTEGTLTAWAIATGYSVDDLRSTPGSSFSTPLPLRWRCIQAHTSNADNKPGGATGFLYWEVQYHEAVNAVGNVSSGNGYSQWIFVTLKKPTASAPTVLTAWEAGDEALDGYEELKVPVYDYKEYCPVGFIHINHDGAFTFGTTALTTIGTFFQAIGPVFPDADALVMLVN